MFKLRITVRVRKALSNIPHFRWYSNKKNVRVRFAPSPTGNLHLGGLRTALYNHLFAKSQNGVSILRIEDTDLTRKIDNATENLIEDLEWCGIEFDEGPYFQSDRVDLYKKYAEELIDKGHAYFCFCRKVRLDLLRLELLKTGGVPRYDNHCRHLTKEEINSRFENGEIPCVRFKMLSSPGFDDLINGRIDLDLTAVEGDPVILKQDGFPTYHFANVIDDHLMGISHVLRGVEWKVSTPKHLLLFNAFGWEPPVYGHLPLLLNLTGTKLSKRQGDTQIRTLREKGFLPNAVLNFVIRFGGGFNIEHKEKDLKTFELKELIEKFNVSRLRMNSCKISLTDLLDTNQLEICRLLDTEEGSDILVKRAKEVIENHFKNSKNLRSLDLGSNHIKNVLKQTRTRIKTLEELVSNNFQFLWIWENNWVAENEASLRAIEKFFREIESVEWNTESLTKFLKEFKNEQGLPQPKVWKMIRKILIEVEVGPSILEILEMLGKDDTLLRLTKSLESQLLTNTEKKEN